MVDLQIRGEYEKSAATKIWSASSVASGHLEVLNTSPKELGKGSFIVSRFSSCRAEELRFSRCPLLD